MIRIHMFVFENDKVYVVEDNQVIAAMDKDSYYGECPHPECENHGKTKYNLKNNSKCPGCSTSMTLHFPKKKEEEKEVEASLEMGDRVSYKETPGNVISIISSIYGDTVGVRFDDGGVSEFDASQLTRLAEEKVFGSKVEELLSEFDEYSTLPTNTLEQLEKKEKIARGLNYRAKSAITDKTLSYSERLSLDAVATTTKSDLMDYEEERIALDVTNRPKYEMRKEFEGWGSYARSKNDDISWLGDLEPAAEVDWDIRLAEIANETVAKLTSSQLTDSDFMERVRSYREDSLPEDKKEMFAAYLEAAIHLKDEEVVHVAEDFDDIPDEAVFM